jgi:serine phosphatase RsbU (regulator of sigma subunit)
MSDLLSEVVGITAAATSVEDALDRVSSLLTARADWVIADRLGDPDLITRVAAYDGKGSMALPDGLGAPSARRSAAGSVGLLPALVEAPRRVLLLDEPALTQLTRSDDPHRARQAAMALELGARYVLLLGLVARDAVLGVLSLGRRQPFADDELAELADIAAHLGAVLDAARLHELQTTVATTMQRSLLPALPAVTGLRLAARYSPASRGLAVGGDWYDAFPTDAGVVLVVGDASGHDVDAVARMSDLRNLLRAHAVDRDEPPSALVARLDRTAASLGLDATATCVVGRLHARGGGCWDLTWTSAGHLPPVLLRDGRAQLLDPPAELMLGVDPSSVRTDHALDLRTGDLLLLYTDGLVEVRGASLQERLELLRAQVQDDSGMVPDRLAERLLAGIGSEGQDDVALLIVEVLA